MRVTPSNAPRMSKSRYIHRPDHRLPIQEDGAQDQKSLRYRNLAVGSSWIQESPD